MFLTKLKFINLFIKNIPEKARVDFWFGKNKVTLNIVHLSRAGHFNFSFIYVIYIHKIVKKKLKMGYIMHMLSV